LLDNPDTSVTLSELEYGVAKSSKPQQNRDALSVFLSPFEILIIDKQGRNPLYSDHLEASLYHPPHLTKTDHWRWGEDGSPGCVMEPLSKVNFQQNMAPVLSCHQ
jgi:hypothetical protein